MADDLNAGASPPAATDPYAEFQQATPPPAQQAADPYAEFQSTPAPAATAIPAAKPAPASKPVQMGLFDTLKSAGVSGVMDAAQNAVAPNQMASAGLDALRGGVDAIHNIVSGVHDLYQGGKQDFQAGGGNPFANGGKSSSPQALALQRGGGAKLVAGVGTAALALDAPQLMKMGGIATGMVDAGASAAESAGLKKLAQVALAKVVASGAAGGAASHEAGVASDALNLAPETKNLIQAAAFFTPALLGAGLAKAGFRAGVGVDAEGNLSAAASSPGGTFKAGARVTPDAFEAAARVGDTRANVSIPRQPPPPTAAQVTGQQMLDTNVATMKASQDADAAAALIVQGKSPQEAINAQKPQPPDNTPDEMRSGVLSQQMVGSVASIIKASPAEDQPKLMMQAGGVLAGWIQKVKQFIGPDGKLASADTPEAAQKLSQTILNNEVDRHDQVAADAQKQAETAQADAQKAAAAKAKEDAKPPSKGATALQEKQYARAKTIIEGSDSPEAAVTAMGRAGMPPEKAQAFIQRHQSEQAAAVTPTVGSSVEPVVEESRATVDAQMDALKAGTIKTVMLPAGSNYTPVVPKGMQKVTVAGDAPGAGTYITSLKPSTIRAAAKAGTHGDLLGHVQSKEQTAAAPQTVAVVAHDTKGNEIHTSEVSADIPTVKAQVATKHEQFPDAQISVLPVDNVIEHRIAAMRAAGDEDPAVADTKRKLLGRTLLSNEQIDGMVGGKKAAEADPYAEFQEEAKPEDAHDEDTFDRAKLRDEVSGKAEQPYDESLVKAVTRTSGATARWRELQKSGASNDDLKAAIDKEMGSGGGTDFEVRPGKFWTKDVSMKEAPTLSGTKLVAAVRRILDIGKPESPAATEGSKSTKEGVQAEKPEQIATEAAGDKPAAEEPKQTPAKAADKFLSEHMEEAVADYRKQNTSGGTLAISSDAARELLPGYSTPAERTANTFDLGPASSKLAEAVWKQAIAAGPTPERYGVEFLTGSPGSGKTGSVISSQEETGLAIVSEGMMDNFDKSAARIQQAIDAGFVPTLRLVYVKDPRITLRRAVARAMEYGRPVAISLMSRQYVEIPKTVARLAEHFGDKLGVSAYDNSVDGNRPKKANPGTAVLMTGRYTVSAAKEAMLDELDKLRNDGKVSPELYDKFRSGSGPADAAANVGGGGGQGPTDNGRSAGKDGAGGEGSRAVEPKTVPVAKGDKVSFTDKGKTFTGEVKHVGPKFTRILDDQNVRHDVLSGAVTGPAPEKEVAKAPEKAETPAGPVVGAATSIITPTRDIPARYRLIEAADLIPSHDSNSFAKNPDYPEGVQERAYDTSKEAQGRVIAQSQNYDPRYTINDNPDATNGPPIITPDGVVLGGNSRAMSTQRMYRADGAGYRKSLEEKSAQFGLKVEDIRAMRKPVLVREVEKPASQEEMRRLGTELNKVPTASMSPSERAVSAGKNIKPETLEAVSKMLLNAGHNGETATLREAMADPKDASKFLQMMVADGAITERERPQYIDARTGGLSDAGKDFIENALLGSVVDDPRVMDQTPKSILNKIEGSLGSIATFASRPDEWNLLPGLRAALLEHGEMARSGNTLDDHLGQVSMFAPERNPMVDAIVRVLDGPAKAVRQAFKDYAQDAKADVPGQSLLLGNAPEPYDGFNHAFGADLSPEEYHRALDQAAGMEATHEQGTGSDEGKNAGDHEGLSGGEAGGSSAGSKGTPEEGLDRPLFAQGDHRIRAADRGFYVEPASGNDAPMLRIDDHVADLINKVTASEEYPDGFFAEYVNGAMLWKSNVDHLLAGLKAEGSEQALELSKAVRSARSSHGGMIILRHGKDSAKGEEQFHSYQAANMARIALLKPVLERQQIFRKAQAFISKSGIYKDDPMLAILEATAKVANDNWASAGLTKDEGEWLLGSFLNGLALGGNSSVLDNVPKIGKNGRNIVESVRGDHAAAESAKRQRDQGDARKASSESTERDSGRLPEGRLLGGEGSPVGDGDVGQAGPRQVHPRAGVTSSPEFKKWFGDSKVIGASGHPLVVYHGTTSDFDTFKASKLGSNTGATSAKAGFFFSESPQVTAEFHGEQLDPEDYTFKPEDGSRIMPVYLSIQNPLVVGAAEWMSGDGGGLTQIAAQAKKDGYDGILVEADQAYADKYNQKESEADMWVAFRPNQIKSAIGNDGSFSKQSPSILHSKSGYLKTASLSSKVVDAASKFKPAADAIAFLGDEADRVAVSRDLHNRLYDLASQDNAAILRAVQMLKQMPGTAKDQEAIYHHMEDPSLPLTERQAEILNTHLMPLIYQSEADFRVITEGGQPLEGYVHRQVLDRGGMIERLIDRAQDKTHSGGGVGGGRLTKTTASTKHRTMMAIQRISDGLYGRAGDRQVVSIKGGRVVVMEKGKEPRDLGALRTGLTNVGKEIDERMAPFVKRVTELRDEIAGAKDADVQEQLESVQAKIADLKKQQATLEAVKTRIGTTTRTPDNLFDKGGKAVYSQQSTFNNRAEITRALEPLLKKEERLKAGTEPMLAKNVMKLVNRKKSLAEAEADRDYILNSVPPEQLTGEGWKDRNGELHQITQATTKEIEGSTNVSYYHNAAASVIVNYLAMDKARRAYDFLEDFKKSPEFAAGSHAMTTPGAIPKGWRATQLPQFRGYFFEPHIAEVLDTYAKAATHEPGVLEKVGAFLRTSIFFNPLIHVPNLLNHWVVEKGLTHYLNPLNYPKITKASIRAIDAVIHQNADFLAALDHGAPLQSQQFETKQFADLFFKKMQDELGDENSSKAIEMAKALGMSPVRLVQAIYKFSGKVTWYTNDVAFMQSTYEKMDRGMELKDALNETAKHIPDYRRMTRIFDNPSLGSLMANPTVTMFGAYHYGALKSYGQVLKSMTGFNWTDAGTKNEAGEPTNSAGRTEAQEKIHGYDVAAMIGVVLMVIYPLMDHLLRMATGNDKAQMRRAGSSTLLYNLAMLAKGEKRPEEVAESIATPAVPLKAGVELAINRDTRTGQRIYDPHAKAGTIAQQVGRRLLGSVAPVDQGLQVAEGKTDWKKLMYSMVGVSFPLHGAEKIASMINAEKMAGLPPEKEAEVIHYVTRSRALHDAWAGDPTKLKEIYESKDFSLKEKRALHKASLMPPLVYETKHLTYDEMVRVYNAATKEQKEQLRIPMAKKLHNLRKAGKQAEEEPED